VCKLVASGVVGKPVGPLNVIWGYVPSYQFDTWVDWGVNSEVSDGVKWERPDLSRVVGKPILILLYHLDISKSDKEIETLPGWQCWGQDVEMES
jgi:hypothetical protein